MWITHKNDPRYGFAQKNQPRRTGLKHKLAMIYQFEGPFSFEKGVIERWNSSAIGVYYCGAKNTKGTLDVYYIGKSTADGGIRGRLLQHISERKWADVTHFGYEQCDKVSETEKHEAAEIAKYKPKYNIQGK